MKSSKESQISILPSAAQKLMGFVRACPLEINGFGIIEQRGHRYVIVDVFITRQHARKNRVVADGDDECRKLVELMASGVRSEQIAFQWHSHVYYAARFSREDITQINKWEGPYMISCVLNKRGEQSCRLDTFRPERTTLSMRLEMGTETVKPNVYELCQKEI